MDSPLVARVKEPVGAQPSSKGRGAWLGQLVASWGHSEPNGGCALPMVSVSSRPRSLPEGCGMEKRGRTQDDRWTSPVWPRGLGTVSTPGTQLLLPTSFLQALSGERPPGGKVIKLNVSLEVKGTQLATRGCKGGAEGRGRGGKRGAHQHRPGSRCSQ